MRPIPILVSLIVLTFSLLGLSQPIKNVLSGQDPINPTTLTGKFDKSASSANFHDQPVALPTYDPDTRYLTSVLGDSNGVKRIEVDLTNQRLLAFEGNQKVYEFPVSTGKWMPTPTGTFQIWGKFRYTKMSGGSAALHTYYYLPNVPYVMFFGNDSVPAARGFSLHGTYWHNNFGHPMSHGCVNMRTEDAGTIFNWSSPSTNGQTTARTSKTDLGTTIIIYGTTPKN